jgi:hypothetical protein
MKTVLRIYGNPHYKTNIILNSEKRTFRFAKRKYDPFMKDQIKRFGGLEKIFIGRYVDVIFADEKLLAYVNIDGDYSLIPVYKLPMEIETEEHIQQIQNYRGDVRNLFALWMI